MSPNRSERPDAADISLLVIHNISLPPGQFGGPHITELFCNNLDPGGHPYFAEIAALQVSAHLLIERDGSIIQFVPFAEKAWHAGQSNFCGTPNCNDFSIGIEVEGDDTTPYTERQYGALVQITRALMTAYPGITLDRIVGHCDIARGRKTDPGEAFDWARYRNALE